MGRRDGELIYMVWDGDPEWWAFRGHAEDPYDACRGVVERLDDVGEPAPNLTPEKTWARWVRQRDDMVPDECESRMTLRFVGAPARGAFPVTVVWNQDQIDRLARMRERRRAGEIEGRAQCLARWPDATDIRVVVQSEPHPIRVTFRRPGLTYDVRWDVRQEDAWIATADRDAWEQLRALRREASAVLEPHRETLARLADDLVEPLGAAEAIRECARLMGVPE